MDGEKQGSLHSTDELRASDRFREKGSYCFQLYSYSRPQRGPNKMVTQKSFKKCEYEKGIVGEMELIVIGGRYEKFGDWSNQTYIYVHV